LKRGVCSRDAVAEIACAVPCARCRYKLVRRCMALEHSAEVERPSEPLLTRGRLPLGESALGATPAPELVRNALHSSTNLDFPLITEICDRLENAPGEVAETVRSLVFAFGDADPRVQLRALTISNELMYSPDAVKAFCRVSALRDSLKILRSIRGTQLGEVSDENMRMLANEVERVCVGAQQLATSSGSMSSVSRSSSTEFSMESNLARLEGARLRAQRVFAVASQKASTTRQSAERALERTATVVLQEAERTWDGFVGNDIGSHAPQQKKARQSTPLQIQGESEDQQLQWAIKASLRDVRKREKKEKEEKSKEKEKRKDSKSSAGEADDAASAASASTACAASATRSAPAAATLADVHTVAAAVNGLSSELAGSMDAYGQSLRNLELRHDAARHELQVIRAQSSHSASKDADLLRTLEDNQALLAGLVDSLAVAETLSDSLATRERELEAELKGIKGGASMARHLKQRVSELEAALAQRQSRAPFSSSVGSCGAAADEEVVPDANLDVAMADSLDSSGKCSPQALVDGVPPDAAAGSLQESIACAMLAADAESPLSAASPKEAVGETQAIVASSMSTPTAEAELGGSWPVATEGAARSRGGTDSDGGSPMAMAGSFVEGAMCGARRYVTQTSIESSSSTGEAEASTIARALNVESSSSSRDGQHTSGQSGGLHSNHR